MNARRSRGQATVELALVLPLVVVLALGVVQAGFVVRDAVVLTHATRAAARAAALGADDSEVRAAAVRASGLAPDRLRLSRHADGRLVTVELWYRAPTDVVLVGGLVPAVDLHERLTVALEE